MKSLVPKKNKGKSVDLEQTVTAASIPQAIAIYTKAVQRLQQPGCWQKLTGTPGASFTVIERNNKVTGERVKKDDWIRVDIPAPGSSAGDGHDWVKVEKIEDDVDSKADASFGLTVKVTSNPDKPNDGVAHFFAKGASSSFIIRRKGRRVTASYHGRNETPNTENSAITDKIRNTIVALGALAGISEFQWNALLKGLLGQK